MSTQSRNDDASDLQEAAEEEEVLELEKEVEQMAQKILEYRAALPAQLASTLSSLVASQRPILPTDLGEQGPAPETQIVPVSGSDAGVTEGLLVREKMALAITEDTDEADEKIQVIRQKISSNIAELPAVLNRMKECMAKIDKLESSNVIIHPAFKRSRAN